MFLEESSRCEQTLGSVGQEGPPCVLGESCVEPELVPQSKDMAKASISEYDGGRCWLALPEGCTCQPWSRCSPPPPPLLEATWCHQEDFGSVGVRPPPPLPRRAGQPRL